MRVRGLPSPENSRFFPPVEKDGLILLAAMAVAAAVYSPGSALAQLTSTTTSNTVYFPDAASGPFNVANWRSAGCTGTPSRQWDAGADTFNFSWNTLTGDQIGSIGVTFGSGYLQDANWNGVQIDNINPNTTMSCSAAITANNHWFYWSIYGWTHSSYTWWGNTPGGWDNEFYIIFYTQMTPGDILAQPGCKSIGSVKVDGVTFDCYVTPRSHQSQWLAVAEPSPSTAWNPAPSVNLYKIFQYWRSQGMANGYIETLSWALEGFSPSAGTLQLTNVVIPNLESAQPKNQLKPSNVLTVGCPTPNLARHPQ